MSTMFGISLMQGPHQLAQKSRIVILCLRASSRTEMGLRSKSGTEMSLKVLPDVCPLGSVDCSTCSGSGSEKRDAIKSRPFMFRQAVSARLTAVKMIMCLQFFIASLYKILRTDAFVVHNAADGLGKHVGNRQLLNLCAAV